MRAILRPRPRRVKLSHMPVLLERLARVGVAPGDSEEERVRKTALTFSAALMASLAVVWVGTYAALGLWWSAAIPFAYQLVCIASIAAFARTKRFPPFRATQLACMFLLPFLLQWTLGGFEPSSGVALWSLTAPLGALVFGDWRRATPWFVAFVAFVVLSGGIESSLADADVPRAVVTAFFVMNVLGVSVTVFAMLRYFIAEREAEQERSQRLLLSILPEPIAARLKRSPTIIADGCPEVSVLFADLVGFTPLAGERPPEEVVALLDRIFSAFDELADRHGLEKIKTIGDAYMVAGGIPVPHPDPAAAVADMALDMLDAAGRCGREAGVALTVRIGIDTGPVVAGVIGRRKFSYDLWGDTVNTASRMESHGLPGEIQLTERTAALLGDRYELRARGEIDVKGMGPMTTWLLAGRAAPRQTVA
jgi:class 3 adenylate cyclase